jgi:hypothetical protein
LDDAWNFKSIYRDLGKLNFAKAALKVKKQIKAKKKKNYFLF